MTECIRSTMTTPDGVNLAVRDWAVPPDVPPAGTALLVHGLGEHAGRYAHVASVLTGLGVAVRSWDQRGFGASGGARGAIPHPAALLDDTRLIFEALAAEACAAGDEATPFLIGHSMGGVVAARAATGGWITPRGLVLSSPALLTHATRAERVAAAVCARLVPNLAVPHRRLLDALSHDTAVSAAVRADALCHGRFTARLAHFILDAGAAALRDAHTFDVPTLLLVAGEDRLVDPAGARAFANAMPPGRCTLRWYDGLWHEVFNEQEPDRIRVLADLRAWVAGQLARCA